MKYLLTLFCFLCCSSFVFAQNDVTVTLGGIADKTSISAAQILDYPRLILNTDRVVVLGYHVGLFEKDSRKEIASFSDIKANLSPELLTKINALQGKPFILRFDKIMIGDEAQLEETGDEPHVSSLEYTVDK